MLSKDIKCITAVTEPAAAGLVCTAVMIECHCIIKNESLKGDSFDISHRKIERIYANQWPEKASRGMDGPFIIIELSMDDTEAVVYEVIGHGPESKVMIRQPQIRLRQTGDITSDHGLIPAQPAIWLQSSGVRDLVLEDFIQGSFEGLDYNLFIPKNYDPERSYPLILFIHDAGCCGTDPRLTLAQGIGATVWASGAHQAKHPCFVLAPQFTPPPMVDDDFRADARIEVVKRLLDCVTMEYSVDMKRIYATGQSMGCMSSCELNIRYPDLFAASLLVAGQWNPDTMAHVPQARLWILVSEGDRKAFPGMTAMTLAMEKAGARVVHETWSARAGQEEWTADARRMTVTGANVLFVSFALETVAQGAASGPGAHHTATWQIAYGIEAVREWLFSNHR